MSIGQQNLCKCGCGKQIPQGKKYFRGHLKKEIEKIKKLDIQNFCACGCGQLLQLNAYGEFSKFINHHATKGTKRTPEQRKRISEAHKGLPGHNKGLKFTDEQRKRCSDSHIGIKKTLEALENQRKAAINHPNYGMKNKKHSNETRKRISKASRKAWKSGIFKDTNLCKRFKSGHFYSKKNNQKIHFRSGIEEKFYKILEQNENIIAYEAEPFTIDYLYNNENYDYHPDVLILFCNNTKELVEVKPEDYLDPKNMFGKTEQQMINDQLKMALKHSAGLKFANEQGMKFEVVTPSIFAKYRLYCPEDKK